MDPAERRQAARTRGRDGYPDRIQFDLKHHLEREFGAACRDRYWAILEELFTELGYRDYLGALQRYRVEHPRDVRLLAMSSYLVDYPFANRLYPNSLDVLERFRAWGPTVLLTDGAWFFSRARSNGPGCSRRSMGMCSSIFTRRSNWTMSPSITLPGITSWWMTRCAS